MCVEVIGPTLRECSLMTEIARNKTASVVVSVAGHPDDFTDRSNRRRACDESHRGETETCCDDPSAVGGESGPEPPERAR